MSDSNPLDQAKNLIEAGQNEQATPIIEEAIRQNPTDARAWAMLAIVHDDKRLKKHHLKQVIAHSTDPEMTEWAKGELADLTPAPEQFEGGAAAARLTPVDSPQAVGNDEAPFAPKPKRTTPITLPPSAPPPTPPPPTPVPASKGRKRGTFTFGGVAVSIFLLVAMVVAGILYLPGLFGIAPNQVAPTEPPVVAASLTPLPTSTATETAAAIPTDTPVPANTDAPTVTVSAPATETLTPTITPTLTQLEQVIEQGRALLDIYELDDAWTEFNSAVAMDRGSTLGYVWRARAYIKLADLDEARADIDTAKSINPDDLEVILVQGDLARAMGNDSEAVLAYTTAVEKYPDLSRPYLHRAAAYISLKSFAEGLADIDPAMQINPADDEAYLVRGHYYLGQNLYQEAVLDYMRAIELNPALPDHYRYAAEAYFYLGDYAASLEYYNKALGLAPKYGDAYAGMGKTLYRLSRNQDAIASLTTALSNHSTATYLYTWRGLSYAKLQQYSSAVNDFTRAIEDSPSPCRYHNRCSARVGAGQYNSAVADCTTAIQGGGTIDTYFTRARAYDGLARKSDALADYQTFLQVADPASEAAIYAQQRVNALSGLLAVCSIAGVSFCPVEGALLSVSQQGNAPLLFCEE